MTYVLVHGGGFAGSCWDEIRPFLAEPSHAVDLPGRGATPGDLATVTVADSVASVADYIIERDLKNVALVGHSMAGLTIPGVAEVVPTRIRRLVFVSCAVPPQGTALLEVLGDLSPNTKEVADRIGDDAFDGRGVLHPDLARAMFCNDMDEGLAASTLARQVPEAVGVVSEPSDLTGLRRPIPRTYIRLLQDAAISLDVQNRMIDNLGETQVLDLDAAHMAMISRPKELAELINALCPRQAVRTGNAPPRTGRRTCRPWSHSYRPTAAWTGPPTGWQLAGGRPVGGTPRASPLACADGLDLSSWSAQRCQISSGVMGERRGRTQSHR